MENNPLCSVVMSVYNGDEFLPIAIESILQQTYKNFEFIIINDASTDNSLKTIQAYNDDRIIIIDNDKNIFLAASLNKGIKTSKGKYILRMDADDISMPDRLEKQVEYMERNPNIGISGTSSEIIGHGSGFGKYQQESNQIKFNLLYECHLLHPTIIIRKDLIVEHQLYYDESYRKNQDYELFVRGISLTDYGNLPDYLIKYRQTEENIKREVHNQNKNILNIQKQLFLKLGLKINENELSIYKSINLQIYNQSPDFVYQTYSLLKKMVESNKKTLLFEMKPFQNHLSKLFENVCRNSNESPLSTFIIYKKSKLTTNYLRKSKILLILLFKLSTLIFKK
tara:strand:- start:6926 stop:7942 length:1017 start_codon:yes stop_codon:yes gene_type:complete